eukprot:jgi/Pico_ML_1/53835/g4310.t1
MASAGEATMFWGVRVEAKSVVREPINDEQSGSEDEDTVPIAEEEYVHITQVALEPGSSPGKSTTLYIEVAGTKFALGTLEQGRCEQFSLDVVVDETFELSHSGKGVVSVTGYRTLLRDMSLFDEYDSEDEDELGEEESEEEEEPKAANNKRKKQPKKVEEDSESEDEEDSEEEDEAPVTGKSKAGKKFEKAMLNEAQKKVAKETKQAVDAYDSGSEEEEEKSEEEEDAGVEGKDFSDMDTSEEESEEDSEDEEAPPKKSPAAKGSKRTAPETPQPSAKKAKAGASTPAKTAGKSPGQTPANTPAKTPTAAGATPGKSPKVASAELKSSIEKTLKSKGKPIDMSAFGKEYEQAVGKKLDYKVEGFRKLRDLIDSVPEVATIRDDGGRLSVASP